MRRTDPPALLLAVLQAVVAVSLGKTAISTGLTILSLPAGVLLLTAALTPLALLMANHASRPPSSMLSKP